MAVILRPDPSSFAPLDPERAARWIDFGTWSTTYFPQLVGLHVEELRQDYTRMRLPYRPELNQPAGLMHGGAIATLIDTVVVPAISTYFPITPIMLTLSLNVNYLGAIREQDAVGEGWVTRRGRSITFCDALVTAADGTPAATASLVYSVRPVEPNSA